MTSKSRTWKRRVGVAMMAATLALAVAAGGAASAQEAEGVPEDAETAEVTKSGFYDAPLLNIIPPSVLRSFPPQVVCLINPKPCTGDFHEDQPDGMKDGYNGLQDGVESGYGAGQENDPGEPESPVPPETLPVSVTTGQARYQSAVAFELPSVPDGHQVDEFKLYLTQTEPSGGVSSPVARQAILAALTCARGCQDDQFEKILFMGCEGERTQDPSTCPAEQSPLQVEMCPIVDDPSTDEDETEWQGERSQDPEHVPPTDCFLGANGRLLDDGETWEFDLSFALEDWASGAIPNAGVLISPQAAPNFAFGDPDSTFNKQVTFSEEIRYVVATSEEPQFDDFSGSGGEFDTGGTSDGGTTASSGGFSAESGGTSSGGNMSSFSAPANDEPAAGDTEPEPEVATGDGGAPAAEEPATEPVAAGEQPEPGSAWYAWLLAPVFLGGMWLTAQSLTAAPAPSVGTREGAMSRLIQQQQKAGGSAASGPQLA